MRLDAALNGAGGGRRVRRIGACHVVLEADGHGDRLLLGEIGTPATATDVFGLERSIVVYERLLTFVPFEHEFGPSGKYRLSLGSEYSPVTQIPYCCRARASRPPTSSARRFHSSRATR